MRRDKSATSIRRGTSVMVPRPGARLRTLTICGAADSLGMAWGWTLVMLTITHDSGLTKAAHYSAAMFIGIVLSAPATGWLSRRVTATRLLRLSASTELLLRIVVLAGIVTGLPAWAVAAAIVAMNVSGWVCHAGMRSEISVVDATPSSLTRYATVIAGAEACGAALAAMIPTHATASLTGWFLAAALLVYPGTLLPTIVTAGRARSSANSAQTAAAAGKHTQQRAKPGKRGGSARTRLPMRLLGAGAAVMLLAGGPTLLSTSITEELYGGVWLAGSAIAFSMGTLFSAGSVTAITRRGVPVAARWLLWGIAMVAGWAFVPVLAPMVLVAQFLAGLGQTALEGDMDACVTASVTPKTAASALAYAASGRAAGSAVGVRVLPFIGSSATVGIVAGSTTVILAAGGIVCWVCARVAPGLFRRHGVGRGAAYQQ
jgi:hypothetical protein